MGNQTQTFDVTIVGAGVIGSALALQLHDAGYRVCLIEAREASYQSVDPERVVALSYGSRCHLDALGVWDQVEQTGVGRIEHIDVVEKGNSGLVSMNASQDDQTIDALGYVVEITQVLEPLHQKIHDTDIHWCCPARLERIEEHADDVDVHVSSPEGSLHIQTRLLVAADGTNSFARRLAKITTRGWDQNRFGLVASVSCQRGHQNVAYECFQTSGPLAFLPLADDRFSIVWALEPTAAMRMLEMPEIAFLNKLERAAGDDVLAKLGRITGTGKRAVFPLELTVASVYSKPRIALAGNAAHTMHPVAGQGMNLGLRDVLVLAEVLSSDLAKKDPGASILMQAYAEQRRTDVLAVAAFTETTLESFTHDLTPSRWVRSRGMDALQTFVPLRQTLQRYASGVAQMRHLQLPNLKSPQLKSTNHSNKESDHV